MKNIYQFRGVKCVLLFILTASSAFAQKKKIEMKDSLDGAFDMSDYLIETNVLFLFPSSLQNLHLVALVLA